VVRSFGLHAPLPSSDALAALTVVSVAGLALYYIDLPARSVLYYAGLPHKVLEEWGRPASERTARNVYFVLLDTTMPSAIRSRAQYYNSMFRIGYEIVLLFCLAGPTVMACAYLTRDPGATGRTEGARTVLAVACGLIALLAACAVASGYLKAQDRQEGLDTPHDQRLRMLRSRLERQVPWVDRLLLAGAVALSALYTEAGHHRALLIGACTIATLVWSFRYLRGAPQPKRRASLANGTAGWPRRLSSPERRNLDASTSTLVLGLTALLIWVPAVISLPRGTHLTFGLALAWSAMTLVGASLMLFRGHETKLWGAYHTVATWMEEHKSEIVDAYEIVPWPTQPA